MSILLTLDLLTAYAGEQDARPPVSKNNMNTQIKIYIAAALGLLFVLGMIVFVIANMKVAKLESEIADAMDTARQKQQTAAVKELEAAQYKQKIDYLETKLTELGQLASKQDEELEKLNLNSRSARSDADAARRTRTITTTNAELCQKLTELGHPCS